MDKNKHDPAVLNMYKSEAKKHILKVNQLLLDFEKNGGNNESFKEIKREVHTLKGDSRMLGFSKIGEAAHKLEDQFDAMGTVGKLPDPSIIQKIFISIDIIDKAIDALPESEIDVDISAILSSDAIEKNKKSLNNKVEIFIDTNTDASVDEEKFKVDTHEEQKAKQTDDKDTNYININLKKIDELINLYSSFPRYSGRFLFLVNQLKILRDNIEEKYHDEDLLKMIDRFVYNFSHEITFFDLVTKQFQNNITKLKLVPLSTIFDLFPRLVRDIALQTNKKINFKVIGGEVELDKVVVEKLKDALIHIVNNAVDHGCESPEIRLKNGKTEYGNIKLQAFSKGDNIVIEISDDGFGLDNERIREKAIEKKMITREQALSLNNEEMIQYIFEPGFSTKDIGKFSGRGIGMDVVATTVNALNGEIYVNTWKGKGTTFTITLPLISFFIPVTIFTLDNYFFAIPSSYIIQVLRINTDNIINVNDLQSMINFNHIDVSIINLEEFMGFDSYDREVNKNIIIIKFNDEIVGLVVNEVIIEKKLIIKKTVSMSEKLNVIIGSVLLGSERAIPVFNIPELFKLFKQKKSSLTKVKANQNKKNIWAKNILLVEDSIITRDHEKKILSDQDLNVFEAANGKEAIKILETKTKFDLLITDIEMPVMDGMELIKYIKKRSEFSKIPVIVISSYKDHIEKLKEIGIDHFINKSDFHPALFIETIRKLNII